MTRGLVIVGCGGFGREVDSLVTVLNREGKTAWEVTGFVDDGPSNSDLRRLQALQRPLVGGISWLLAQQRPTAVVIAIGNNQVRQRIATILSLPHISFPALVHPDATIAAQVTLGEGTVVAAGARVNTNVSIGRHVQLDQNATIGHDSQLGPFSRLNPQACVSGNVSVEEGCLIGASATVLAGLRIGSNSTIGAAACVTRDVARGSVVKGVPAR